MDDASPPKWHLAHVTWFFETFLLRTSLSGYRVFNEAFHTLFNSYYNGVGQPFTRAHRGFLSRPILSEIIAYREHVDEAMVQLMTKGLSPDLLFKIELGLHHEQQHQELILTDIKYNLGNNPLQPAYSKRQLPSSEEEALQWREFEGGLIEIGANPDREFVFDNETPRHQVFLQPYKVATQLVTNQEFIEFIEDDGYSRAELWLSDGWSHLQEKNWTKPLYWQCEGSEFIEYCLSGVQPVDPHQAVCHVSGYEADAFARWKSCRLISESEWEHAAQTAPIAGNFVESGLLHPTGSSIGSSVDSPVAKNIGGSGARAADDLCSMFGNVWEWTSSSYGCYPGYQPFEGQLGEYNGKFMANQLVLRGGSCATPKLHIRATYRNFFYPPDRWQFSGIRLARDLA